VLQNIWHSIWTLFLGPDNLQNVFLLWSMQVATFPALSPDEGIRSSFMALNAHSQYNARSVPLRGHREAGTNYCGPNLLVCFFLSSMVICWLYKLTLSYQVIIYVKLKIWLFVPYTNSHFWTNLNQKIAHMAPWPGRDRRLCMVRNFLTFTAFFTFFVASECPFHDKRWLPAEVTCDRVISMILAGACATSRERHCSGRQVSVLTKSVLHLE